MYFWKAGCGCQSGFKAGFANEPSSPCFPLPTPGPYQLAANIKRRWILSYYLFSSKVGQRSQLLTQLGKGLWSLEESINTIGNLVLIAASLFLFFCLLAYLRVRFLFIDRFARASQSR